MFELFLVILTLTSPILIVVFTRNYFQYKSEVNQKLLVLSEESNRISASTMHKKLDILTKRVIILEQIVTDTKFDLSQKINQL